MRRGLRSARKRPAKSDPASGLPMFADDRVLQLMRTEFGRARRHGLAVSCMLMQPDAEATVVRTRQAGGSAGETARRVPLRLATMRSPAEIRRLEMLGRLLGEVAREQIRGHDHVGMLQADRYLLMLPHTRSQEAVRVAERIADVFSRAELRDDYSGPSPTLSSGVTCCEPRDVLFFETIVRQAELALEQAVAGGGARCVLYRAADPKRDGSRPAESA